MMLVIASEHHMQTSAGNESNIDRLTILLSSILELGSEHVTKIPCMHTTWQIT
jgi:hypothetical protein